MIQFFMRFITTNRWRQDLRTKRHRRFDQTRHSGSSLRVTDDRLD